MQKSKSMQAPTLVNWLTPKKGWGTVTNVCIFMILPLCTWMSMHFNTNVWTCFRLTTATCSIGDVRIHSAHFTRQLGMRFLFENNSPHATAIAAGQQILSRDFQAHHSIGVDAQTIRHGLSGTKSLWVQKEKKWTKCKRQMLNEV